jgi:hypothetical protein
MDHGLSREREPWEGSDGAICLLREVAGIAPMEALAQLPLLAQLAEKVDFTHAHRLQERIWIQLPMIAEGIVSGLPRGAGKRSFKEHLQSLLEPLFGALQHGPPLVQAAAGGCLESLARLIGEGILLGRLNGEMRDCVLANPSVPPALRARCLEGAAQGGLRATPAPRSRRRPAVGP